jgi:hypothetical protein
LLVRTNVCNTVLLNDLEISLMSSSCIMPAMLGMLHPASKLSESKGLDVWTQLYLRNFADIRMAPASGGGPSSPMYTTES